MLRHSKKIIHIFNFFQKYSTFYEKKKKENNRLSNISTKLLLKGIVIENDSNNSSFSMIERNAGSTMLFEAEREIRGVWKNISTVNLIDRR